MMKEERDIMVKKILIMISVGIILITAILYKISTIPKSFDRTYSCFQYRVREPESNKEVSVTVKGNIYGGWFKESRIELEIFEVEGYNSPTEGTSVTMNSDMRFETEMDLFTRGWDYKNFMYEEMGYVRLEVKPIGNIYLTENLDDLFITVYDHIGNDYYRWDGWDGTVIAGDANDIEEAEIIRKEMYRRWGLENFK